MASAARVALIRKIILLARETTAEYVHGIGALCPVCVELRLEPPPAKVTSTMGTVRYHHCDLCGNTFKSVERHPKPIESTADVAPIPRKHHRKGKGKKR